MRLNSRVWPSFLLGLLAFSPAPPARAAECREDHVVNSSAWTDSNDDTLPDIAADGLGNVVAVWIADSIPGIAGSGAEIYYSHSGDGGTTWSPQARVTTDPSFDMVRDFEPVVAADEAGHFVIAWTSNSALGGTLGTDMDIMTVRSSDGGLTWSPPAALNASASRDDGSTVKNDAVPEVANNALGTWITAFGSSRSAGGAWDIRLWVSRSTDAGVTWSADVSVFSSTIYDILNVTVAGDERGNWVIAWQTPDSLGGTIGADSDILAIHSSDDGLTWSAPAPLNSRAAIDSGADGRVKVVADGGGVFNAIWYSYSKFAGANGATPNILHSRSTDGGATWSASEALIAEMNTDSRQDTYSSLVRTSSGELIAAWASKAVPADAVLGGDADILYATSNDQGLTWIYQGPLNQYAAGDAADDLFPSLCAAPNGGFLAAWMSGNTLGGTIGTDLDIFVGRHCEYTPTPSPSATDSPSPSPTPSETPSLSPSETASSTPSPTPSLTPTASDTPTASPSPSATARPAYDGSLNEIIYPPAALPVQRHPIHVRMLNTGTAAWTPANPVRLEAVSDPCGLFVTGPLVAASAASTAPGVMALFTGWVTTPDQPGTCSAELRLTAAPDGAFGEPVDLTIEVGDALDAQLLGDWWGGLARGSGSVENLASGGLCMTAPLTGDNILGWVSPEGYAQLIDMTVYRIRVDATTDQSDVDSIPVWDFSYDNYATEFDNRGAPAGLTYAGESVFVDVAGGAEGVGRPDGRRVFELWAAPNALETPQWRGLLPLYGENQNSAFTPGVDTVNDFRLVIRALDLDSSGLRSDVDSGRICATRLRMNAIPISAMGSTEMLWNPPIGPATHAAERFDQAGAGRAEIDEANGSVHYELLDGTSDGSAPPVGNRKTLLPFLAADFDPANPSAFGPLYPVRWESDTLYMGVVRLRSEASPTSAPDPVDSVFVNMDTPTSELVTLSVTLRGAPGLMDRAASPRADWAAGSPQPYVTFMHGHNSTLADLGQLPDANRLRVQADFINTPEIAPQGRGSDPFAATGLSLAKVRLGVNLGEE